MFPSVFIKMCHFPESAQKNRVVAWSSHLKPNLSTTGQEYRILARNEFPPKRPHFEMWNLFILSFKPGKVASHLSWGCWSTLAKDWHRCLHTRWHRSLCGSPLFELLQSGETRKQDCKGIANGVPVNGIPNQLISDNMPFNSQDFKDFAASYELEVITSSPGYPQSNG